MKGFVNLDIAVTHIVTRRKQTLVAALGVTIGIAIYLFMNSLASGFSRYSRGEIFKNNAHIRIFSEDAISQPLEIDTSGQQTNVIINPQITNASNRIHDPEALLSDVRTQPYVTQAIAQVSFDVFYHRGKARLRGSGSGVHMPSYSSMFNTAKYMVAGTVDALAQNNDGIIIGSGIAEKLNLGIADNLTMTSSFGVTKTFQIVGIFTTGSSMTDDSKCYVTVSRAQQLLREGPAYISSLLVNTIDPDRTGEFQQQLQQRTEYRVEDWKTSNADVLAGDRTQGAMMMAISMSILLVAGFGIYNILSSTITQKINDIAILKATGFLGRDVVRIFVTEALIMGFIGTVAGLGLGALMIQAMSKTYMGGPVGYFPIRVEAHLLLRSFLLSILITLGAGYFPARKAARVDPVEIFRR